MANRKIPEKGFDDLTLRLLLQAGAFGVRFRAEHICWAHVTFISSEGALIICYGSCGMFAALSCLDTSAPACRSHHTSAFRKLPSAVLGCVTIVTHKVQSTEASLFR